MTRLPFFLLFVALGWPAAGQILRRREVDPISPQVENIYDRGLRYLATSQNADGAWDDAVGSEPGVVGLCIKAFLGRGEDPVHGPWATNLQKALDFIITNQRENGYIGSSMYSHGFATLALAECYGMFPDPRLAPSLEKAINLILSAQKRNNYKAWRYNPESSDADSTVTGCQLVALYAARNAGIPVPDEALRQGMAYMARCRSSNGGYGYTSGMGDKPTLTAIGLTCQALAQQEDSNAFTASLGYLKKELGYRDKYYPFYFEYYMSQALFHADIEVFEEWNKTNIRYLGTIQSPDGSFPGSKGAAFSTSGALLSLALNYRILPIYER